MASFQTFRVLLDDPAAVPALGYGEYARAFSEVIRHSEPQFAIGIFGDWGSGKTTLMRAIQRELEKHKRDVVCVWFNAWRYEREPDLIVPLLDTLREQLAEWAQQRKFKHEKERGRRVAAAVGQAARALIAGTRIRAGVPAFSVEVEPGRVLDTLTARDTQTVPLSFYHRSFNAMRDAVADFVDAPDGGIPVRRVVVFVDDLDRCLPNSALQVLESMKLFFDLSGFVFVVGLDREVIERSIEAKYGGVHESPNGTRESADAGTERQAVKGADYVKKIFQVPFGLPRISADDLEPFFRALVERTELPDEQRADLDSVVWPHIAAGTAGSSVNPREVKRLINAYTLQMKMLTVKLKPRRAAPDPNVVLALQAMAFRADWERFYELLTADPELFVEALRPVVNDPSGTAEFSLTAEPLPRSLLDYIRTTQARALLVTKNLDVYVTTAEATRSSDPAVLEAQAVVAQIARVLDDLGRPGSGVTEHAAVSELHERLNVLISMLTRRSTPLASEAIARTKALVDDLKERVPSPSPDAPQQPPEWAKRARRLLTALQETLGAMRKETFVGSGSG